MYRALRWPFWTRGGTNKPTSFSREGIVLAVFYFSNNGHTFSNIRRTTAMHRTNDFWPITLLKERGRIIAFIQNRWKVKAPSCKNLLGWGWAIELGRFRNWSKDNEKRKVLTNRNVLLLPSEIIIDICRLERLTKHFMYTAVKCFSPCSTFHNKYFEKSLSFFFYCLFDNSRHN